MDTLKRNKRIIMILTIFTIIFTFFGASLAYWNWETAESQKTNVVFTLTQDFSCAADGGGDITQVDAFIAPAKCTSENHAIKREIKLTPTIFRKNLTIYMELWLKVNSLDIGLKNSDNFKYAFTTSSESCTEGVISQGNLKNLNSGDTKVILNRNFSSSTPATYYLWVWLDEAETSTSTMDQSFSLTLDGACTDNQILVVPEGGMYMVGTPEDEVNPSPMSYSMKKLATNNVCNYDNAVVYNSGDVVKVVPSTCDKYLFGDYEYIYNAHLVNQSVSIDEGLEGWGVININSTNASPGQILSTINNKDVVSMSETFKNSNIVAAPEIPSTIKNMNNTFNGCSALKGTIKINANPSTYSNIFSGTSNSIKIFGTSSKLDEMANSANNVTVVDNVPEAPQLDDGMIPVKLSSNGTVKTIQSWDPDWYNYENKEWANVVLVNDSSRSTYKNTTGVTVNQSDILAYYVWIPRYSYRITEVKCSTIDTPTVDDYPECYRYVVSDADKSSLISLMYQYVLSLGLTSYTIEQATSDLENGLETGMVRITGTDMSMTVPEAINTYNQMTGFNVEYETEYAPNNMINAGPRPIDIDFESTSSTMKMGDAINTYRTHSAFWWDDNSNGNVDSGELVAGIWVGKFETTGNVSIPTILPNVDSLTGHNVSTKFLTSQKFSANGNIYGLSHVSTNAHMMKNSEWGAVAYLSHSNYGINGEIRINNYFYDLSTMTGCGALDDDEMHGAECKIPYNSLATPQSTTGNITGVFDMVGGTSEYVMGVLADSSGNPRSGFNSSNNSGFNGLLSDGTEYVNGINFPSSKYYDLYTGTSEMNSCNDGVCYGHALSETAWWYDEPFALVSSESPWIVRGGSSSDGSKAGVFRLDNNIGNVGLISSLRSVLVIGYGP